MVKSKAISKQKAIELIADLLFEGKKRNEIVQLFAKSYKISQSNVDKYIKPAKVIVAERIKAQEEHTRALIKETREAVVKRLGLDFETVLSQYHKLAFFNIKNIYTVDGGMKNIHDMEDADAVAISGIESYDEKEPESGMVLGTTRKVKISEKKAALDSICKILGYEAPTKVANVDADGNTPPTIVLNIPAGMIVELPSNTEGEADQQ